MYTNSPTSMPPMGRNPNAEYLDIAKAWVGTSLAYALFMNGGTLNMMLVTFIIVSALTCGLGIILHEVAHRVVARTYGAEAHFVSNDGFLALSVLVAFGGIFIAAPGAVWHRGTSTSRQSGIIALAGPATNMVLALIFFMMLFVMQFLPLLSLPFFSYIFLLCSVGFEINGWLGLFNLIPLGPFDGAKVMQWDTTVFWVSIALAAGIVFLLPQLV